jgi:hypothetical protein
LYVCKWTLTVVAAAVHASIMGIGIMKRVKKLCTAIYLLAGLGSISMLVLLGTTPDAARLFPQPTPQDVVGAIQWLYQ